jgi:hypothetical protein
MAVAADDSHVLAIDSLGRVLIDAVGTLATKARRRLGSHLDLRRRFHVDRERSATSRLDEGELLARVDEPRIKANPRTIGEGAHGSSPSHNFGSYARSGVSQRP